MDYNCILKILYKIFIIYLNILENCLILLDWKIDIDQINDERQLTRHNSITMTLTSDIENTNLNTNNNQRLRLNIIEFEEDENDHQKN